ncbi:MAG: O-antigen ligase family protein [bacterium]
MAETSKIHRKWYGWALFFVIQLGALINLAVRPELPLFPLIAFSILTVVAALVNRKTLIVLIVVSILASEALYVETGAAVIRVIDIVLALAVFSLLMRWFLSSRMAAFEPLPKLKSALALLIAVSLVSLLGTISLTNSLLEIVQIVELLIAAVVFFNVIKDESDIRLILITILIYGVVDATWIFAKYVQGNLQGRHIGIFETLANELNYGVAIAVGLYYSTRKDWLRHLILLGGVFQLTTIFLTQGRGLLITAIVMALVCAILFAVRQRNLSRFVFVTTVLTLTLIVSFFGFSGDIQSRFASVVEGGELRDLRLIMWAVALKVWQAHPIFGVGVGNIEIASAEFIPKTFGIVLTALGEGLSSPHNEYLSFAMQGGWIGFLSGIAFYTILLWQAIKLFQKSRSQIQNYSILLVSFVIGLITYNMANDTLLAGKGMLVMLFIALLARIHTFLNEQPEV